MNITRLIDLLKRYEGAEFETERGSVFTYSIDSRCKYININEHDIKIKIEDISNVSGYLNRETPSQLAKEGFNRGASYIRSLLDDGRFIDGKI